MYGRLIYERIAAVRRGAPLSASKLLHRRAPLGNPLANPEASGVAGPADLSRPMAVFDIASNLIARSLLSGSGGNVRSFASARVLKSK